ncbi:MAG: hypothetical protein ACRDDZ_01225 [Marinifilaceae bacterium]
MESNKTELSPDGVQLKNDMLNHPDRVVNSYTDVVYTEVGEEFYRIGNTILALNCFNKAVAINASNQKAKAYADMIREVLDFYHKDLLNP